MVKRWYAVTLMCVSGWLGMTVSGCGGGGETAPGTIIVRAPWMPIQRGVIPVAAQSVRVEVLRGGSPVSGSAFTMERSTESLTKQGWAAGAVTLRATAYSAAAAQGSVVGRGDVSVRVPAGGQVVAILNVDPLRGSQVAGSAKVELGPAGGTVRVPEAPGWRLEVPPGALKASGECGLEVQDGPDHRYLPRGVTPGLAGVTVTLPTAQLSGRPVCRLVAPRGTLEDVRRLRSVLATDDGYYGPVKRTYGSDGQTIVYELPLPSAERAEQLPEKPKWLQSVKERGKIRLVSWFVGKIVSQPRGQLYRFNVSAAGVPSQTAATPAWNGRRVALLVHGMANSAADMHDLAVWLGTLRDEVAGSSSGRPVYDEIWLFNYVWTAPIAASGDDLARLVLPHAKSAARLDLYGHSMGGLVSRWAIEQKGLGKYVDQLVTLGTPHDGVPAGVVDALLTLLANYTGISANDYLAGVLDLTEDLITLPGSRSFLDRLNDGYSPHRDTIRYYTLAGSNWERYTFGAIMDSYYNGRDYWLGQSDGTVVHDGIVPQYSAQASALERKSTAWASQPQMWSTTALSHAEIRGSAPGSKYQSQLAEVIRPWVGQGHVPVVVSRSLAVGH